MSTSRSASLISIDGSYGEGGGQILRNAAAFAAMLGEDVRIYNVRLNRSKPGLKSQHLTGLNLLVNACGGTLEGGLLGSTEVVIRADVSSEANFCCCDVLQGDTKTAGSICLLMQAALPFVLFADSCLTLVLKGGTNASMAPQFDYFEHVFLPTIFQAFQLPPETVQPKVIRRGFFPRGGGEVHVHTKPCPITPLPSIILKERGNLRNVWIRSYYAGNCPRSVAEYMTTAALNHMKTHIPSVNISSSIVFEDRALGSGSGILLVGRTTSGCLLGGSALGSPKISPTDVGVQASAELCETIADGGCVDEYLQDQLILYMAMAGGTSEIFTGSLTLHTQTAIWTAEQLCQARFEVCSLDSKESTPDSEGRIIGPHRIRCEGIGYTRKT